MGNADGKRIGVADMDMEQTQEDILNDLHELATPIAQYSYLLECGTEAESFDESLHCDENLIRDCAVNTWLAVQDRDGVPVLVGDSESLIVRGAISLLEEIYNYRSASEVGSFTCTLLDDEMFTRHFSAKQRKGLVSAIAKAQELIVAALAK